MAKGKDLETDIMLATAKGIISPEDMVESFSLLNGGQLLKPVPTKEEKAAGLATICHTLDTEGNVLVAGTNYMFRGNKVKVLREEFSAGNALDTRYRVYYLGSDLEEHFDVANARYPKGVFASPVYNSNFQPIKKE